MGLFDDFVDGVADFFGLGGGGGGSSVSYGVISTIQGGETPVGLVSTIQGSDKPLELVSTLQGGEEAVVIDAGLDDVNVDVGGTGTPLATSSEFKYPDTIMLESDLDLDVDVEPVQVDLCVNVGFTKLPQACIRQPYESHFGVTVLGSELVGFNWRGESQTVIDDLRPGPHVEPGRSVHVSQHRPAPAPHERRIEAGHGGLQIRVG